MNFKEIWKEIQKDLRYLFKFLKMELSGLAMVWVFYLCGVIMPEDVKENMVLVAANDWLPPLVILFMTVVGAWEIFSEAAISAIRKAKRLKNVINETDDNKLFMGNSDELPDDKAIATEKIEEMFAGINVEER